MSRTLCSATGAVAAILLAIALSGCTGPAAAPSASPEAVPPAPTPSPSETPADPLDSVVALVIQPEALELRDVAGTVVVSLPYTGDVTTAITTLTAVIGMPPTDEPYAGTNHHPPGVQHTWGDLEIDERQYDPAMREEKGLVGSLSWPSFAVYFDGPTTGDVTLATVTGLQAKVPWTQVEEDPGYDPDLWTCAGTAVVDVAEVIDPAGGATNATVIVEASEDGATAAWLGAPEMEADGCA